MNKLNRFSVLSFILIIVVFQLCACSESTDTTSTETVVEESNSSTTDDITASEESVVAEENNSDWIGAMTSIWTEISNIDTPIINAIGDGMDLSKSKEYITDEYIASINNIIAKVQEIDKTGTELDSYNDSLINALSNLSTLCSSYTALLAEVNYADNLLLSNHILVNLYGYTEIEDEISAYISNINQYFSSNGIEGTCNIDFTIAQAITNANIANNKAVLTAYVQDYVSILNWTARYLNGEINDGYANSNSFDELYAGYTGDAVPLKNEVVGRYSGTILEGVVKKYEKFIDDYGTYINYAVNSNTSLNEMQNNVSTENGRWLRAEYKNWTQSSRKMEAGDYMVGRLSILGLAGQIWDMAKYSEENEQKYIDAMISHSDSFSCENPDFGHYQDDTTLGKTEYEELRALVAAAYSSSPAYTAEEYNSQLSTMQEQLNNYCAIYKNSYTEYEQALSDLATKLDINITSILYN